MSKPSSDRAIHISEIKLVDVVKGDIGYRQGRILTIVEASMPEGSQLKATKDLIREEFGRLLAEVIRKIPWKISMGQVKNNFDKEFVVK